MSEYDIILDKIKVFEKMYDVMRIVNPVKKEVSELREGILCKKEFTCYNFWEKQGVCDNCISMRAYNENDTMVKMEYKDKMVYMVTAIPISFQGEKLIVELLKDATNSLFMQYGEQGNEMMMLSTIEQINQDVIRDKLTGLYNRRFIDERLAADLIKSSISNEPLSIIFADLDFFKSINDTYGHIAGDQVLREFADELKKYIHSENDWVARYGGEEFLVCLTNTDINSARSVAEEIRINIMKKKFLINNESINVTVSLGVHTVYNENQCLTVDGVIEIADKNLYRAKAEGRNRVV